MFLLVSGFAAHSTQQEQLELHTLELLYIVTKSQNKNALLHLARGDTRDLTRGDESTSKLARKVDPPARVNHGVR